MEENAGRGVEGLAEDTQNSKLGQDWASCASEAKPVTQLVSSS